MSLDLLIGFANVSTVGACIICKLPQILNIWRSGHARGLNVNSVFLELLGFTTMFCYAYSRSYAFFTYAEYAFLVLQDLVLLTVLLHYLHLLNLKSAVIFAICLCYELALALDWYPVWLSVASVNMCIPISAGSKYLQLKTILQSKDASQVSVLTWGLAVYSCIARIFTGIVVTGDKAVLLMVFINFSLNVAITFAAIYYKNPKSLKSGKKV